ncbi:MAG: hypothetical protein K2G89_07665 [Lachnospiraceae bacterium]|nr:hypothetical protein [Lachnospiraceae bacterium]
MTNLLCIAITMLLILGVGLCFHILLRVCPEEGWASAIMSIMVLIYVTGLLGNTKAALILLFILGDVGLLAGVIAAVLKKKRSIITFITPGIVMIFVLAGFAAVMFHGFRIINWDELYQWGKAANYMVQYDKLASGTGFEGESVLLSSTTFFHYVFSKLSFLRLGYITESNYYVSNIVLWFSALLLPFAGDGWNRRKEVWAFGLLHFMLASVIFVQPYYNIYVDQATAYWSGTLIAWVLLQKYNKRNLYLVPLVLLNVGLMKSMEGPLFAVIVLLAIVLRYCFVRKEQKKKLFPDNAVRLLFSGKGILGILVIICPFVFMGIWSAVTGENGLFRGNGNGFDMTRILLTAKTMFGKAFLSVTLHDDRLYISFIMFMIIALGLVCIVYPFFLEKEEIRVYQKLMYVYVAGSIAYFCVMLFAYVTVFPYVDSVQAISMNRYYSDYMMLGVVPLTYPLFMGERRHKRGGVLALQQVLAVTVILVSVYISSPYFMSNLSHAYRMDKASYAERENFVEYAKKVKKATNGNGKIYFVTQKKSEKYALIADYELGAQLSRGGMCFKFRENLDTYISGNTEYDISMLPSVLRDYGYEYLWIYSSDDYFKENMKEMFGIKKFKSGSFYRVIVDGESVKLEYMKNVQK